MDFKNYAILFVIITFTIYGYILAVLFVRKHIKEKSQWVRDWDRAENTLQKAKRAHEKLAKNASVAISALMQFGEALAEAKMRAGEADLTDIEVLIAMSFKKIPVQFTKDMPKSKEMMKDWKPVEPKDEEGEGGDYFDD
ncbi:MAG: hypothetical protein GTO24_21000 [candidate division Zixibacteria bacterium]|nr:hypothetical protein [candidate division Zixibacteria bacterium]